MSDRAPIIRFPTQEEQDNALNEFAREMQRAKERRESVPPEKLHEALETISDYLRTGWSTGGGRRLRQFVWSLWNGFHLINLFNLSSALDGRLTDAVVVVLKQSGPVREEGGPLLRPARDGGQWIKEGKNAVRSTRF